MFEMKPLDFDRHSLEPYMSEQTLNFHYGKHYKAYVDKLNELVRGTKYEAMTLEKIMTESRNDPKDKAIYNNAGQVWNHEFFWQCLTPSFKAPTPDFLKKIEAAFGSYEDFEKQFKEKAVAQFGSGWCWLVEQDNGLKIITTANADNPISLGLGTPLLCVDVWEHAYYLDYQNRRADFVEAFLKNMARF